MAPIEGVIRVKGDITKLSTAEEIISHFDGKLADLVVSDGAPDGIYSFFFFLTVFSHWSSRYGPIYTIPINFSSMFFSNSYFKALNITTHILRKGGNFLAKIFRGKDITLMYSQLKIFFTDVTIVKPKSSRNSSLESFVLCQNYSPPEGYIPTMINPILGLNYGMQVYMACFH